MKDLELAVAFAGWIALMTVLVTRPKAGGPPAERKRGSLIGIAIQGIGFAILWAHPPGADAHADLPPAARVALLIVAAVLLAASTWFVFAAINRLGRQWSFVAAVRPDHALVTTGPYGHVRHPIYAGMFGMLLGTGFLLTSAPAFVLALLFFLAGTSVRIRIEERLMRSRFGGAYDDYAVRVPALVPRLGAIRSPQAG